LSVNDTITLNIDYAPVDQIKPRLTSAANPTMSQDKLLARVTRTDIENLTPQERVTSINSNGELDRLEPHHAARPKRAQKDGLADRLRWNMSQSHRRPPRT